MSFAVRAVSVVLVFLGMIFKLRKIYPLPVGEGRVRVQDLTRLLLRLRPIGLPEGEGTHSSSVSVHNQNIFSEIGLSLFNPPAAVIQFRIRHSGLPVCDIDQPAIQLLS